LLAARMRRIDYRYLIWNQVAVGVALSALYLSVNYWPYWVHLVRIVLRDIPTNFSIYQFMLGTLFTLIFFVPIGLCGLCLPLCFHLLKDRKDTIGHRVGRLYAVNTLGCVFGALLGGYGLLYFWNL